QPEEGVPQDGAHPAHLPERRECRAGEQQSGRDRLLGVLAEERDREEGPAPERRAQPALRRPPVEDGRPGRPEWAHQRVVLMVEVDGERAQPALVDAVPGQVPEPTLLLVGQEARGLLDARVLAEPVQGAVGARGRIVGGEEELQQRQAPLGSRGRGGRRPCRGSRRHGYPTRGARRRVRTTRRAVSAVSAAACARSAALSAAAAASCAATAAGRDTGATWETASEYLR